MATRIPCSARTPSTAAWSSARCGPAAQAVTRARRRARTSSSKPIAAGRRVRGRRPTAPRCRCDYRLEVDYPDGNVHAGRPVLVHPDFGEIDLYLAGEGRHERLYDVLGAHVTSDEGVDRHSFAVWAPNAARSAVVGDFNSWDWRLRPMRSLGASGIWELFVPARRRARDYKYEILPATARVKLKADPFAFATEMPPHTASVVHVPRTSGGDEKLARAAPRQRAARRSRCRSTRCTSARGGATRSRATAR